MNVGSHEDLSPDTGEQWQLTDHQKGMPGPAKFEMTQADFSGRVNADIQFIADRLAILNHMTAYSFLLDEGRWDAWYELFAEDVVLQITTPSVGALTVKGKDAMKAFTDLRYAARTTTMRRHTMGNVHVTEQNATTAKVRAYLLIATVPNADKVNVLTMGTYNATMAKREGRWLITRWYVETDAPVASSAMPTNVPAGAVTFIPDTRAERPTT